MKRKKQFPIFLVAAAAVAVLGALALIFPSGKGTVSVKVPRLSPEGLAGREAFAANCAQCHGENGSGTNLGPPLVHDIYNPGHHGDDAFRSAVRGGVRQHHWSFGDMPPLPQVTDAQLLDIVRYMRELQQANGIVPRAHGM